MARKRKAKADKAKQPNGATPPGGGDSNAPPPDTWLGLEHDDFRRLLQHLCRVRNRRLLFGGKDDDILANGPAGMCGLLVSEVYNFLRNNRIEGFPSQQDLAATLNVNSGSFGQYLTGVPSRTIPWVAHAQTCAQILTTGTNQTPTPDIQPLAQRLEEYFFRGFNPRLPNTPPSFFEQQRARFGEPMSIRELAGEIEWYAVEREVTCRAAKLLWVSGGPDFFPGGADGSVGRALRRAIDAEVQTTFVYHGQSSRAAASLHELRSGGSATGALSLRDTDERDEAGKVRSQPHERWWNFISPTLQFLYMWIDTGVQTRPEETLFILRGEADEPQYGPIALEANRTELTAFKVWMQKMGL